jgi:type IV secretion system protein VirB8
MFQPRRESFKPEAANAPHGDDLGPYPADVDNAPTRQRILERALRAVTIVAVVEGLIVVALVCLLIAVFPLKEVYPYLVTFRDNQEQIVAIEPLAKDAPGIEYATELNVRDYVTQRHGFMPVNSHMDAQWGPESRLAAMTEAEEFKEFEQAATLERERMMASGFSRQIQIESATMIRPDTWQVSFTTFASLGGHNGTLTANPATTLDQSTQRQDVMQANLDPTSKQRRWLATMTIDYRPDQVSYDRRLLNPLGFTVTDYSVTGRN